MRLVRNRSCSRAWTAKGRHAAQQAAGADGMRRRAPALRAAARRRTPQHSGKALGRVTATDRLSVGQVLAVPRRGMRADPARAMARWTEP
jgi:hypothetical protein